MHKLVSFKLCLLLRLKFLSYIITRSLWYTRTWKVFAVRKNGAMDPSCQYRHINFFSKCVKDTADISYLSQSTPSKFRGALHSIPWSDIPRTIIHTNRILLNWSTIFTSGVPRAPQAPRRRSKKKKKKGGGRGKIKVSIPL